MDTERTRVMIASLLAFAFLSACTTMTQGSPQPGDSVEATTSSLTPRPSDSAPSTSSTEDATEPEIRDLAERYVDAVNNNDEATLVALNCAKTTGLLPIAANGQTVTITDELERAPAADRYYIGLMFDGRPAPRLTIIRQDGAWCVRS